MAVNSACDDIRRRSFVCGEFCDATLVPKIFRKLDVYYLCPMLNKIWETIKLFSVHVCNANWASDDNLITNLLVVLFADVYFLGSI